MCAESTPAISNTKTIVGNQNGSNAATYVKNTTSTSTSSTKTDGQSNSNYENKAMADGLKENPVMAQSAVNSSTNLARLSFTSTSPKTPPTGSVWTSSPEGSRQISSNLSPSLWVKAKGKNSETLNTDRSSQLTYSAEEGISDLFDFC